MLATTTPAVPCSVRPIIGPLSHKWIIPDAWRILSRVSGTLSIPDMLQFVLIEKENQANKQKWQKHFALFSARCADPPQGSSLSCHQPAGFLWGRDNSAPKPWVNYPGMPCWGWLRCARTEQLIIQMWPASYIYSQLKGCVTIKGATFFFIFVLASFICTSDQIEPNNVLILQALRILGFDRLCREVF